MVIPKTNFIFGKSDDKTLFIFISETNIYAFLQDLISSTLH